MTTLGSTTLLIAGSSETVSLRWRGLLERAGYTVEAVQTDVESRDRLRRGGIALVLIHTTLKSESPIDWMSAATGEPGGPAAVVICDQQAASVAFRRLGTRRIHMVREAVAQQLLPWVVQQALSTGDSRPVPIPGYLFSDQPLVHLSPTHY